MPGSRPRLAEMPHVLPVHRARDRIALPQRVADLERELALTRRQLQGALRALERAGIAPDPVAQHAEAAGPMAELTSRQREILELVLAGHPSKIIAADLRISRRTVENHRASIMKKTGAGSLPALARLAVAAFGGGRKG